MVAQFLFCTINILIQLKLKIALAELNYSMFVPCFLAFKLTNEGSGCVKPKSQINELFHRIMSQEGTQLVAGSTRIERVHLKVRLRSRVF